MDDDAPYPPPVHDDAGVHVLREKCSTCIFRPGNLMELRPGRLADLVAETRRHDTNVVCHQTLDAERAAFCRGSVDESPGQMMRIAERLGAVVLDDAPAQREETVTP